VPSLQAGDEAQGLPPRQDDSKVVKVDFPLPIELRTVSLPGFFSFSGGASSVFLESIWLACSARKAACFSVRFQLGFCPRNALRYPLGCAPLLCTQRAALPEHAPKFARIRELYPE
jgi:hypothetical protein